MGSGTRGTDNAFKREVGECDTLDRLGKWKKKGMEGQESELEQGSHT